MAGGALAGRLSAPLGVCFLGSTDAATYLQALRGAFPLHSAAAVGSVGELQASVAAAAADLLIVASETVGGAELARSTSAPLLFVKGDAACRQRYPSLSRVLLALDGSTEAEATLPYAARLQEAGAQLLVLLVPDGDIREDALRNYGERVAELLRASGDVQLVVGGSGPARTIVEKASESGTDLVVLGRHGAGSLNRKGR